MTLFHDDAYKIIESLLSQGLKVDHIITDPPYNISQNNHFTTMQHPRKGLDFGHWDRGKFDLYSWIPLYCKLLKSNGSFIVFCSYKYISYIVDTLENPDCGMVVKDIIVWQKSNPMPRNTQRRYVQDMEFAIWAVRKNAKWVFNKPDGIPYLRSLFTTSVVCGKEKLGHPTQKNFILMQSLVRIHTNPQETILDPFMGSGTTGAAALSIGRNFIGIEKEQSYFEMAQMRLSQYENF